MKIKTRIAPSPTGDLHVGTAYIALFNYAFAKKNKGEFVIRIEDTDQKRNIAGADTTILDGLRWLGLNWDGEPAYQSKRLDLYQKHTSSLLKSGKAFKDDGGVILKAPNENISWVDEVRGKIEFPSEEIKDFVIQKSDGFPTYNFAVAVDDSEIGITHVIRAEDHISNTPRQIIVYKALGKTLPKFAHFPLLRNADKSKISKRKNPVAISWFKNEGFLPEALVNFLCLLGWSHPEQKEVFDLDEFVKHFSLDRVKKSAPIFDMKKLEWLNGEYIRALSDKELSRKLKPYIKDSISDELLTKITPLVKSRIKKLSEYNFLAGFFAVSPKIDIKLFSENYQKHLQSGIKALTENEPWSLDSLNKLLLNSVEKNEFRTAKFFMDLRIAITGQKISPPINDSIAILGKQESLKRLNTALNETKN